MKRHLRVLIIGLLVSGHSVMAADCERPRSSEEVAGCLGEELRSSDARINQSYQAVMKLLGDSEQKALRAEQRSWIKERDAVCNLDTREKDRERWYRAILLDYSKTVCVTRYTRVRTTELEQLLTREAQKKSAAQASAPAAAGPVSTPAPQSWPELFPKEPKAYRIGTVQSHSSGRWYWEVMINVDEIAKLHPTTLWMGCASPELTHGNLLNIRAGDSGRGLRLVGIALDLEDGKMYLRTNGNWERGAPGSAKGLDLKLGRMYRCGLISTIAVDPLQKSNFLDVNFGSKPFRYALPDGYRPLTTF